MGEGGVGWGGMAVVLVHMDLKPEHRPISEGRPMGRLEQRLVGASPRCNHDAAIRTSV